MKRLALILLLFTISLRLKQVASSEIANGAPLENANVRSNDIQDSHLERVHVKQESGFDGKVRSIRFSIEPEEAQQHEQMGTPSYAHLKPKMMGVGVPETFNSMNAARMSRDTKISHIDGRPKELRIIGSSVVPPFARSSRVRRSSEKNSVYGQLDDLQADESKVFRPLFAYRQQVAKRLKVKNDRRTEYSNRRRVQRMEPSPYNFYYPYQYPAYPTVYRVPLPIF